MDGHSSTAVEQARQHHNETMPDGDLEVWRIHPTVKPMIDITVITCKEICVNFENGWFCTQ